MVPGLFLTKAAMVGMMGVSTAASRWVERIMRLDFQLDRSVRSLIMAAASKRMDVVGF
jgi:hypothetical protein